MVDYGLEMVSNIMFDIMGIYQIPTNFGTLDFLCYVEVLQNMQHIPHIFQTYYLYTSQPFCRHQHFWKGWKGWVQSDLDGHCWKLWKEWGSNKTKIELAVPQTMGFNDGFKPTTGNQHLGLSMRSLKSWTVLDDIESEVSPSKSWKSKNESLESWNLEILNNVGTSWHLSTSWKIKFGNLWDLE